MRTATLLTLVLLISGCSAPQAPPVQPSPSTATPSPMSTRGLSLTLAAVKDLVQNEIPLTMSDILDPETEADAESMSETMTMITANPEFVEALMAATASDLAIDGAIHTFRYAEDAVGDDSGYSMVVMIDFRLGADGTAYLHAIRAAG